MRSQGTGSRSDNLNLIHQFAAEPVVPDPAGGAAEDLQRSGDVEHLGIGEANITT